jgi:hypothetical protein
MALTAVRTLSQFATRIPGVSSITNFFRNIGTNKNAQRVVAATGAAAATTTTFVSIDQAMKNAVDAARQTGNETTSTNNINTPETIRSLNRADLTVLKFPLDIENAPVPYVLIKIFETQTGAVPRQDLTTQSLVAGAQGAAGVIANNATLIGAVGGAAVSSGTAVNAAGLALLALGRRGVVPAAVAGAATVAAGAAAGAAAANFGGEALQTALDSLGNSVGFTNAGSRSKELISQFALKRNLQQLDRAIALLMPETLAVSYSNRYEEISLTGETGNYGLVAQALGSTNGGAGQDPYIMEAAGRLAEKLVGSSEKFTAAGLFATTGRVINPQMEMIYSNPDFRQFVMDFRLVPRNQAESGTILSIIKNLKFYAAPQIPRETGGRYFIPPAQFEIEFYDANNSRNQFLFRTKKCVLEDVSIDYTENGVFTTFYDGAPVAIRLSLKFRETVFIDREAIQEGF